MGKSVKEPISSIGSSVGGLVWVRRRNGSWWPGRILGPVELPEGCIPTPRSGTPVKLLGREDASVDWYNLEKSKRVKAFRCGEFDDCIEKAKPSVSKPTKKAVKYARREDAILHALEIESAHCRKDTSDGPKEEKQHTPLSPHDEDINAHLSSSADDSDFVPEVSCSGVSLEEPKRLRTSNDSEDDGSGGAKRMRGLKDLGINVNSSSRRKRSQVARVCEISKRKPRSCPLAKVLECTAMVSIPVVCDQLSNLTGSPVPSESKDSGLESNESKINNSVVMNNSNNSGVSCENANTSKLKENEISSTIGVPHSRFSGTMIDVPLVAEQKQSADVSIINVGAPLKSAGAQSSHSSHVETLSFGNEDHNETVSTGSAAGAADVCNISQTIEKGSSQWQLKGKRNSRPRNIDMDSIQVDGSLISRRNDDEFHGWGSSSPRKERQPSRQLPYRQSRFVVNPKYNSDKFPVIGSGMFEVKVGVKSNYGPQHVPYISLMSKLRGGPIIGHPLQVEVLHNGFCNDILECYSSSSEPRRQPSSKNRTTARRSGGASKKTRKLSSLSSGCREERKPVVEKLMGPAVACVPLNVVFSRFNAALNR